MRGARRTARGPKTSKACIAHREGNEVGCIPLSSPMVIPLLSTMFTFRSSSRGSNLIICKFWVEGGWSTPFHTASLSMLGSLLPHDQTDYNTNMMSSSDLYNHGHKFLALHNCNKLVVHNPFLVPFLLDLIRAPKIQHMPFLHLGQGLAFRSVPCRQESDPSLVRSFCRCVHHGLPTYRNYKTIVRTSTYTSAIDDNYL